ncbi:MAG: four helix bundle protein, partial [Chitinophagales bacterium]|nr:four helix bundle protein [Chitinophagales bacterium]
MNTKSEFVDNLKSRFKKYVIRSTKLYQALPKTEEARIFGKQFLRSASSAAANHRASCRARSDKEFFAKMSIVVEEIDESCFWIELLYETEIIQKERVEELYKEGMELLSICSTARKTIGNNLKIR